MNSFWSERSRLVREEVIPYQWRMLNDEEPSTAPSHTIENFRIAAGESTGQYQGMVFQDSDLSKWLEAVGFSLRRHPNPELETLADSVIDLMEKAQEPNGYLDTYFIVAKPDEKWTNVRDLHELYCAGHLIEGAVAYYQSTGKTKILDISCRLVDHIMETFGEEDGKIRGYPGHEEIELALVKLYRVTGRKEYLTLSKFFVDERGAEPRFFAKEAEVRGDHSSYNFAYSQSHAPVREQNTAEGHAVRAMYLYSAMADLAAEYQDESLLSACRNLWDNVTKKRMYITGGIGSSQYEESFTVDFDLPNDRAYTETCAAIGLVFWAHRMLQIDTDGIYGDVIDRALYNGILSGMSLDGKKYFYVNPLEVWPSAALNRHDMTTVKPERQKWFGCACCPPNIARLVASIEDYLYSVDADGLYVHTYTDSEVQVDVGGHEVTIVQRTEYPWDGQVDIELSLEGRAEFDLVMRIPSWCRDAQVRVNGEPVDSCIVERGYMRVRSVWSSGDRISLSLPMVTQRIHAHPQVRADAGKVALQRGPMIYCMEEVDNGENLSAISIADDAKVLVERNDSVLGGIPILKVPGRRDVPNAEQLYEATNMSYRSVEVTFVPYFSWCNRTPGEMLVWVRTTS
ncbi:glycoside hydrolase family 127 protein [Alicyclobacillus sp. SO9]|uniref:glycoside hydrolase family 127 protein n=1 Tax=Alicyclobacillus sp. SO9 TaxID=2665646 RepID=UPI001E64A307|nr:beta-L-arabinofuranosidase domain-containing protein [Alicyclobacillus sp. SO9]